MCGICGVRAFSDAFACDEATVVAMRDTLVHRGPDDAGAYVREADGIALGHRRLSIVDLSSAGRQPMANEDGTVWLTYNGEVYNHVALRAELERAGHVYRSHTDSETIVHLWEEEGPACVERLHGMFALAIWDTRKRELFLARDRLGVKPLYYAELPGGVIFGSEVKALLAHPALTADLDLEAFHHYLTYAFAPAPMTLFAGVKKVRPGERILIRADGSSHREVWWSPFASDARGAAAAASPQEAEERTLELLRESITKRMMSDVPFGVFLSGGLDSSTNVALMSEASSAPVKTFSTAPEGHERYDELSYARLVADRFQTEHHEVLVAEADLEGYVPELVHHLDEPTSDWTAIPQHFVSKLARDSGVVVVQVGEGADEIFHGYQGYVDHRRFLVPFQRFTPSGLQPAAGRAVHRLTSRLGRGIRHGEVLLDAGRRDVPYWGGSLCFRGESKAAILGLAEGDAGYGESLEIAERYWHEAEAAGADLFQRMTYVELKQRLPELLLMRLDKIAMASSVEGREPFLDHELVEWVMALPPKEKHDRGVGKAVLRRAMRGLLPDEVIDRPKQGFGTPMPEWLRGGFGVRAQETVRRSSLVERGAIDPAYADRLFELHRQGRGDWSYHLWNLFSVAAWHDRWIAGRAPAAL
jgi:asparagine synthase (glutamine-hydrolysing)